LKIARRSSTSGTTAATEAYFLNKPCGSAQKANNIAINSQKTAAPGSSTGVAYTDTTNRTGQYGSTKVQSADTTVTVVEASSSSVVLQLAGNTTTPASSSNDYVIGVASLENVMPVNSDTVSTDWKFLKLDGTSPVYRLNGTQDLLQKDALLNGQYGFIYESELVAHADVATDLTMAPANRLLTALVKDGANHGNLDTSAGVFGAPLFTNAVRSSAQTGKYGHGILNQCGILKSIY
jgi:hypothetical protein